MTRPQAALLVTCSVLAFAAGCSHRGPKTIGPDRFDYAAAIGESAKAQTLLNVVKLRYVDTPVFLDVQQVVAGYNWEHSGSVGLSAGIGPEAEGGLGYEGTYVERPTISYVPIGGRDFVKSILTPASIHAIVFLVQSAFPIDHLFGIMVQSINGKINAPDGTSSTGAEFSKAIATLAHLQRHNALAIHIADSEDDQTTIGFRRWMLNDELSRAVEVLQQDLGLDPTRETYRVVYDSVSPDAETIAIETRSILKILVSMAAYVELPEEHRDRMIAAKVQLPTREERETQVFKLRIRSGEDEPERVYAKTYYNDYWFWVDDEDIASKRVFTYLSLLFSVTTGTSIGAPNLVINTN